MSENRHNLRERALEVAEQLLAWYAANKRDLPWRDNPDPYHVLVSEIMLQQTQVERVIPKYHAWLERFPTLEALAAAPTADVIRQWSGLGYNRRAINLQRLAQYVVEHLGGELPSTVEGLLPLPGIGRYTAGAVACFGFGAQVATVDTNIRRVLGRVFCGEDRLELPEAKLFALAEIVLPEAEAYAWNQAMMDLGATICTSNAPACPRCPLNALCLARPMFDAMRYPDGVMQGTLWGDAPAAPSLKRKPVKKSAAEQVPFTATRRYFRGRIIERLRLLSNGETLDLAALGAWVKPDFTATDAAQRAWLLELVQGLERDGLLKLRHDDAHRQIAEERVVYGDGVRDEADRSGEWEQVRVMLP